MASNPPAAIGDARPSDYVLVHEELPLPPTRKEVVARVETILNFGGVAKILVQMGKPISYWRHVRTDTLGASPRDAPLDDLFERLRNGEMQEIAVMESSQLKDAPRLLLFAFGELEKRKLRALRIFVGNWKNLRRWLDVDDGYNLSHLFGVEVEIHHEMPDDAILVAGVSYDEELDNVTLGIRIPMEITEAS